jgi:rhodanese-related sulfurtransferase
MNHKLTTLIGASLLVLAFFLAACSGPTNTPAPSNTGDTAAAQYLKITAEEAKSIMDDGSPFILLDVRTPEEFAAGHIEGALLIPDNEIASRAAAELPDKDARILLYCRTGIRAAGAANALISMGYTGVYDMGGIVDWPYGTVTE